MSAEKPQKKEKRAPEGHPRQDQIGPRTPRMVGTITRARCSNCGGVLQPGFDPKSKCPRCAYELHSCKQCAYFDTAARFECMQPVAERIPRKDQRNDCTFYEFRTTIEKDTAPSRHLRISSRNKSGLQGSATARFSKFSKDHCDSEFARDAFNRPAGSCFEHRFVTKIPVDGSR
jgi:hypothetical protein